jgi:hypothetical protein
MNFFFQILFSVFTVFFTNIGEINSFVEESSRDKINSSPNVIEDILLNKTGFRYTDGFIQVISDMAKSNWKQGDYENSNYFLLGAIDLNEGIPEWLNSISGSGPYFRALGCCRLETLGEYKFGTQVENSSDKINYSSLYGCSNTFTCNSLQPVFVETETGETGVMPALIVKYLSKQMIDKNKVEFLSLSVSLMMPEVFISKARALKIVGKSNGGSLDDALIAELKAAREKFSESDLLWIFKNNEGRIIFLEKGNSTAGLEHILNHKNDFINKGIKDIDISDFIMQALKENKIVGYQGTGTGRPIYELIYRGKKQQVAITTGSNGFVVGANPISF